MIFTAQAGQLSGFSDSLSTSIQTQQGDKMSSSGEQLRLSKTPQSRTWNSFWDTETDEKAWS